jgi:neutral trehalase
MDNSPRFDTRDPLIAIDFCCFMANDVRHMKLMADELGLAEDAAFYQNWFEQIAKDTNELLWVEEDGFYFDFNIPKQEIHKVWSVASFLPLFAGICNEAQVEKLVKHLQDPETFGTPFPIPSVARNDVTFGSDMWRGPVWINFNYMVAEGLANYGRCAEAAELVNKTITHMGRWYQDSGVFYEFYDSANEKAPSRHNRKGLPFEPYNINVRMQTIRDYGWSNTLLCDMIRNSK